MTVVEASAKPETDVERGTAASGSPARALRLAYLVPEYPKVSHTFIRREIAELERLGHSVLRISIRDTRSLIADEADRSEAEKTIICLSHGPWSFAGGLLKAALRAPLRFARALGMALKMGHRNNRGQPRHVAYFVEACLLLQIVRRHGVEHIHAHFGTNAAGVARLIQCLGGPTYSMTVHGPEEFDAPRDFRLAEKVGDALFVAAITSFCAGQIRRWTPYDLWDRIHIIHCTVDDRFLEGAQPVPPDSRVLLSIGRLSASKAQWLLVEAMHRLVERGGDCTLVLAGDGELREVLQRRIAELGLEDRIVITGWVGEQTVRDHLIECRALVQPSFAEGLPVVMMEALAMARPVISSTIAGVPELVRDGENGWLIPAGDVDAIVRAMEDALATPASRLDEMGRAGREQVAKCHLARIEAARLAELFDRYVHAAGR